jgi:hypothetical protein
LVRKASWEGLCPDSVVIRSVTVTYYYFSFGNYLVQLLSDLVHVVSVPELLGFEPKFEASRSEPGGIRVPFRPLKLSNILHLSEFIIIGQLRRFLPRMIMIEV